MQGLCAGFAVCKTNLHTTSKSVSSKSTHHWQQSKQIMTMEAAIICKPCNSNTRLNDRHDTSDQAKPEAANQPFFDRHRPSSSRYAHYQPSFILCSDSDKTIDTGVHTLSFAACVAAMPAADDYMHACYPTALQQHTERPSLAPALADWLARTVGLAELIEL